MLPYSKIIALLQKYRGGMQKIYFQEIIDELNNCYENNQTLSGWCRNRLIHFAKTDYELREILIANNIFDINWVIYDYCQKNKQLKQNSIKWFSEQLPVYDVLSNNLTRESIELGKTNSSLRNILRKYYFVGDWLGDLNYEENFKKILNICEDIDLNRYNWGETDNAKIFAKIIINKGKTLKVQTFIDSFLLQYKFEKDYEGLINPQNLFYYLLINTDQKPIDQLIENIYYILFKIPNKEDGWSALVHALIIYYSSGHLAFFNRINRIKKLNEKISFISNIFFRKLNNKLQNFKCVCIYGKSDNVFDRIGVSIILKSISSILPKSKCYSALEFLLELLMEDSYPYDFKIHIIESLCLVIKKIPESEQNTAWELILHYLVILMDTIKLKFLESLENNIEYIPQTSISRLFDLIFYDIEKTNIENQTIVAELLGFLYPKLDKVQQDLIRSYLEYSSTVTDNMLSASSNYSLGRIHIFYAIDADDEEDFQKEVKIAIKYYEDSYLKASYYNRARFCYPLYKSYYAVTFEPESSDEDIEELLICAFDNAEKSRTKNNLIKSIYNLYLAVKTAKNFNEDIDDKKKLTELQKFCDKALSVLSDTKESAPNVTSVIRRGLPKIDQQIKQLIQKIQNQTDNFYEKSKGTLDESIAKESKDLSDNLDPNDIELAKKSANKIFDKLISKLCPYHTHEKKQFLCDQLNTGKKTQDIIDKLQILSECFDLATDIYPTISEIILSNKEKNIAKIAVVQINFQIRDEFPFSLDNEKETKEKFEIFLEYAISNDVDLIIFPELSTKEKWIRFFKDKYPSIVIVFGSFYKEDFNISPVLFDSKSYMNQKKNNPSDSEDSLMNGIGMKRENNRLIKYQTKFGSFVILICRDFLKYVNSVVNCTDFILVPSLNPKPKRFHDLAHVIVTNNPSYIIISNNACYGGTSIFGQIHNNFFNLLRQNGCKMEDDDSYKICEFPKSEEGIIIASFNVLSKSISMQSPGDTELSIRPVQNIIKKSLQEIRNQI